MQIKYLSNSVYKLYNYACTQTIKSDQIERRKKLLGDWEILKNRKVPDSEIVKITGISRATYYRLKKAISIYGLHGLEKKSKRPKKFRQSKIPKEAKDLVLNIRIKNPTYGKGK